MRPTLMMAFLALVAVCVVPAAQASPALTPGAHIRIPAGREGAFHYGTLIRVDGDSLWMTPRRSDRARAFTLAQAKGLQVADGMRRSNQKGIVTGIAAGSVLGAIGGAIAHAALNNNEHHGTSSTGGGEGGGIANAAGAATSASVSTAKTSANFAVLEGVVLGGVVGGIVGGFTGAGQHETVWADVPLASAHLQLGERSGAFSLALSWPLHRARH